MKLPILLSVPHSGWKIPPEVQDICILTKKDILEDGDVGAAEIYYPLKEEVETFITTDIGRAHSPLLGIGNRPSQYDLMIGSYGIYDRVLLSCSSARPSKVVIDPGRA
jgi:N-formylglutamate amidohydrolase